MTIPPSLPELADVVVRILAERGPLATAELVNALGAQPLLRGLTAREVFDELVDSDLLPMIHELPDGRWCDLGSLLRDRVITHRLTADEARLGYLTAFPDLAPLLALLEEHEPADQAGPGLVYPELDADLLADLGIPPESVPAHGAWLLPTGFARAHGLGNGGRVTVRATDAGLVPDVVPAAAGATEWSPAARQALDALLSRRADGVSLEEAAWAVCAADPSAFTAPGPTFTQLIEEAGGVTHGETLLPPGTDPVRWAFHRRIATVAHRHRLGLDDAAAVTLLTVRFEAILAVIEGAAATDSDWSAADALLDPAIARLADPAVAQAVLAETVGLDGDLPAAALGVFVDEQAERLPDAPAAARAALVWLRARAVEQLDRPEDAEADLTAAVALDATYQPALADLAYYASDRGDLDRALDLARRAHLPVDDPLLALLRHLRDVPVRDLGRNQPCWCGSGRKYKVCHLGREQIPLAERAVWLYQKAGFYLDRSHGRHVALDLAQVRARHRPGELWAALQEPIVADVALVEGGVFADFLASRGALLPDDERLLAEQWLLTERTVWEVAAVRPGRGMTMRDVRTGDVVEVREATASRVLRTGQLWCGRVLPAGDTWQVFGGLEPVPLADLDRLLAVLDDEADALAVIEVLSRRFAPPVLQNTDGEALLAAEAVFAVPDPESVQATLDREFERADDEPDDDADPAPVWHLLAERPTGRTLHATLRLSGDRLTLETNSAERQDRMIARLAGLVPGLEPISDRRVPMADLPVGASATPAGVGTSLEPEAMAEVLAEVVARHEAAWLDEQIPALAGLTPRQALLDPTRREDLVRLLDSFPQDDAPGQMSAHRLRAALGLADR